MRLAGLLLAQLQPPGRDAEVGVALDDHAAILGPQRERALERARGVGIERLQLHVAPRLAHRSEAIACARVTDVTVVDHPLVARHLSVLRDRATPSGEFRRRMREAAMLIGFEALRDLRLAEIDVETPLETTAGARLGDDIVVIAILRAGLGMVEGFLALMPEARVGHLGMYRDEDKLSPVGYYESIPEHGPEAEIVLVDPMLATGGSAASALRVLKERGAQRLRFVCLVAAPEGLEALRAEHPEVPVFCASIDRQLDERGYIRPGLGDAGDRLYGTD
jgi:uracil phosphoribosyltransferase